MSTANKKSLNYIITGAIIAAAYVAITFITNIFGLNYGPIQFRVAEVMTILPVFTPAAIPGITLGCFIANTFSFNLLDMVFGTMATLTAALLTYLFRNIKFKGLPLLAMFPPVIINAVVIGAEIAVFYLEEGFSAWGYLISGIEVGLGQLAVCYVLGIPFYLIVKKYNLFTKNGFNEPKQRPRD